ncbi:MAG: hypothetical protein HY078_13620 [Elusimicrobia bacterium]|nr:hypothetical protein [Elusimicrobiota bacterium]
MLLHLGALGFYSDDWAFLRVAALARPNTFAGVFSDLLISGLWDRPVEALCWAAGYSLFGLGPPFRALGYHELNLAVNVVGIWLLYLALVRLRAGRSKALAAAALYAVLPHYSTDRLWASALHMDLMMTLYFASLLADLEALGSQRYRLWRATSLICMVVALLGYELALPLFVASLIVLRLEAGRLTTKALERWRWTAATTVGTLVLLMAQKFAFSPRLKSSNAGFLMKLVSGIARYFRALCEAGWISAVDYGAALPRTAWRLASERFDPRILALALVVATAAFCLLRRAARADAAENREAKSDGALAALGLLVFGLGYGVFLGVGVDVTSTGLGNRANQVAALGAALVMASAAGRLGVRGPTVFAGTVALAAGLSCFVSASIAPYWAAAWTKEQEVAADIRARFDDLPRGGTFLLDGVCPFVGPATVFQSSWDLQGMLSVLYGDQSCKADVVNETLKFEEHVFTKDFYGWAYPYPYGENVILFNFKTKETLRLKDRKTALEYFARHPIDHAAECGKSADGKGVRVF